MRKSLASKPNLEYIKREAKALKRSIEQNKYVESYRIAEHLTSYRIGQPLSLTHAQFVIAREYGFSSWLQLKQFITSTTGAKTPFIDAARLTLANETINITCGDIASAMLKRCNVPGQRLPWKDILCIGPHAKCDSDESFLFERAKFVKHWTQLQGLPDANRMAKTDLDALRNTLCAKSIVLWIWPHLSNQILFIFLINWYAQNNYSGELYWVDVSDKDTENENCSDEAFLKTRIDTKTLINKEEQLFVGHLWQGLSHGSPSLLVNKMGEQTKYFPAIIRSLWRYIEELPSRLNGLSAQQHAILEAINEGHIEPNAIYRYVHRQEKYFIVGDWYFWTVLAGLMEVKNPLIKTEGKVGFFYPPVNMSESFSQQKLVLTEIGKQVLAGQGCHIELNNVGRYWGGLSPEQYKSWRYDPVEKTVIFVG